MEYFIEEDEKLLTKLKARLDSIFYNYFRCVPFITHYCVDLENLDFNTLLKVGKKLTLTKGPHPNWKPGTSFGHHKPPYPTEDLMRMGILFQRMNLKAGQTPSKGLLPENDIDLTQSLLKSQEPLKESNAFDFDLLGLDLNPDLL